MFFLLSILSSTTLSSFLLRHYEISWSHLRKIFRKTRQMRSARVANHFLQAPVVLTALLPHRRQFVSACPANWFPSIIASRTRGEPLPTGREKGGGIFFFFILFQFSVKVLVINGLDKERARCLNERLFRLEKITYFLKTFEDTPRNATVFPISSLAALNYITRSCRVTSQTTISTLELCSQR